MRQGSFGVASNGLVYSQGREIGRVQPFRSGAKVGFLVDFEKREMSVVIDGVRGCDP